jgi:hypothetical protein
MSSFLEAGPAYTQNLHVHAACVFTEKGPPKEGKASELSHEVQLSEEVSIDKFSLPFHPLNH